MWAGPTSRPKRLADVAFSPPTRPPPGRPSPRRQQLEVRFLEQRQARADEDSRQLDTQRVQDAEDYAILKIRLETEIQTLEQDLEEMRATYQLNSEKLDYNYRVLQERDQENTLTIQQQKRKIARLQDVLSTLKGRYAKEDRKFKADNAELTDEFKRLTEQFKELQSKFVHFEHADTRRCGQGGGGRAGGRTALAAAHQTAAPLCAAGTASCGT